MIAPEYLHAAAAELAGAALEQVGLEEVLHRAVRLVVEATEAVAAEVHALEEGATRAPRVRARWPDTPQAPVAPEQPLTTAIHARVGRPWGRLVAYGLEPASHEIVSFLDLVARLVAVSIDRARIEEEMRHQAMHDALTGLANRSLFLDRLEHAAQAARRTHQPVAVLFLDFDRFKLVNDSYGHQAGDALLRQLAARLRSVIRPGDTVARLGGDEFAVVAVDADSAGALELAHRLTKLLSRPVLVGGHEHVITPSVGVAVAHGPVASARTLLRNADAAMYRGKELGQGRVELFDAELRRRAREQLDGARQLRRALDEAQLRMHYQPIIDVQTRTVVGAEALARWQHPDRGLLEPHEFIALAEAAGLIVAVGRWVLGQVIPAAARWVATKPDFWVSVNLSAHELSERDFVDHTAEMLRRCNCPGSAPAVEVTESTMLERQGTAQRTLEQLHALGITAMLDDFGTGYSSLAYLGRLPVDMLKIPAQLIGDVGHDSTAWTLAASIRTMARAMDLSLIGEGVETEGQHNALRMLRYDLAQGFLYGRPVHQDNFLTSRSSTPQACS